LNLGRHFPVAQDHGAALCARLEELGYGQQALWPRELPPRVEVAAQRYAAFLLVRRGERQAAPGEGVGATETAMTTAVQAVDVDSLELTRPRSVGVEQVALGARPAVGFVELLIGVGLAGPLRSLILGVIMGRLAYPASERATRRWLRQRRGLGEWLAVDFEAMAENARYRASDALRKQRSVIEEAWFSRVSELVGLEATVTRYELTTTSFEGEAAVNPKAAPGPAKEKRTDCPWVTWGWVLDGSGLGRRSECLDGNGAESTTLAGMLQRWGAPAKALVVMDRGLAAEDKLAWRRAAGYRYLVVSRERERQFDPPAAVEIETAAGDPLQWQLMRDASGQEVRR
jgi:hypothetical protein